MFASASSSAIESLFSFLAFLLFFLLLSTIPDASIPIVAPAAIMGIERESDVKSTSSLSSSSGCCFTSLANTGSFLSLGLKTGSLLAGLSSPAPSLPSLKLGRFFSGAFSPISSPFSGPKPGSFFFAGSAKTGSFLLGAACSGVGELTSPTFSFLI